MSDLFAFRVDAACLMQTPRIEAETRRGMQATVVIATDRHQDESVPKTWLSHKDLFDCEGCLKIIVSYRDVKVDVYSVCYNTLVTISVTAAMAATNQTTSLFFSLPREIRDNIYHHVFQSIRCIHAVLPPCAAKSNQPKHRVPDIQLRHQLVDRTSRAHSHLHNVADYGNDWLLTCKAIMFEAMEQFSRNAEWFWDGYPRLRCRGCKQCPIDEVRFTPKPHWTTRLPVNTSRITRMELYVQNLANFETPYRYEGTDVNSDLAFLANIMRNANISLDTLRFVGHSYLLRNAARRKVRPGIYTSSNIDQIPKMMQRLMSHFQSVHVRKFEFGIIDRPYVRYWVLYEWVDGVGVKLLTNQGPPKRPDPRPEEDLEKLLPAGWILKRPTCGDEECDDCNPL
ncbi:hypothetical protein BKA63DRAFT_493856 [Paraphoma chrysanthemicola]|nr:hypothetical protein BKA63DRAFT_493856 [Paraphoma chrysanthemicola]